MGVIQRQLERRQRHREYTRDLGLEIRGTDGELIHEAPAEVATSVRYLLARVQSQVVTGLPKRLALTSALRGEGVTYLTRTLASAMAHDLRSSVCIVDLDWWAGDPRDPLPAEPPPGIGDVVTGDATLDDILVPTDAGRLWMAPAGVVPVARRPVVSDDDALDAAIEQLADRFDVILLELPPLLETSDGLPLSRLCDGYVLVVRHGVTAHAQARRALEELSGSVCLGVVLNRYETKVPVSLAGALTR